MNKRLARVIAEQDNARPLVAKLQVLLSNQQLPQNPDIHFKTLHSKNRCETCKCISFKTLPEIVHMNAMWFNTDLNGQSLGKM